MTVKRQPSIVLLSRSLPLLWLSAAFLCGLLLADCLELTWWYWAILVLLSLLLAFFENHLTGGFWQNWRRVSVLPLGLVAALLFSGALRYQTALPQYDAHNLLWYARDLPVKLEGLLLTTPQTGRNSLSLRLSVENLQVMDQDGNLLTEVNHPQGILLVSAQASNTDYRYGDRVTVQGVLTSLAGMEADGFRQYLYRQGIQAQISFGSVRLLEHNQGNFILQAADELRSLAQARIYRLFPQPEAALLAGILVGNDNDLPPDVQQAFQDSGTSHIIAISGFNMAIIAGLITLMLGRLLPAGKSLPLVVAAITFYTLLTGASPSVVRAAIMSVMGVVGVLVGRRQLGINSLLFTAALMCLVNPLLPWDISFQLSFAATLGLIWYAGPLQEAVFDWMERWLPTAWAQQIAAWIGEFVLCTLAAQLTTLPVMLYHFQRLSLSALLANIVVLPVQSFLMILGGVAVLVGLLLPPLGQLLAYPAWVLLAYTIRMVILLAALPAGVLFTGTLPLWVMLLIYALLFLWSPGVAFASRKLKGMIKPAVVLTVLGLTAVILMRYALSLPRGNIQLTLLGGGDQITALLRTPGGQILLINGATTAGDLSSAISTRLSPFERHLDAWFLTDDDADVFQEFYLLNQRFVPRRLYLGNSLSNSLTQRRTLDRLADQGVTSHSLVSASRFNLGDDAVLRVIKATDEGTAFLLEWHQLRVFIPGGVPFVEWSDILNPEGVILLLSKADLATEDAASDWLYLRPCAVLSTARENVPDGWVNINQHGWVNITSDGYQLWLEAGR